MGLLVLRFGAIVALVHDAFLFGAPSGGTTAAVLLGITAITAVLLLVGFATPIAAALMVAGELSGALLRTGDEWAHVLLIALGTGLALLGPGAWSIDARLFGRRRVIGDRTRGPTSR
jgi:putative oxidoreductase